MVNPDAMGWVGENVCLISDNQPTGGPRGEGSRSCVEDTNSWCHATRTTASTCPTETSTTSTNVSGAENTAHTAQWSESWGTGGAGDWSGSESVEPRTGTVWT